MVVGDVTGVLFFFYFYLDSAIIYADIIASNGLPEGVEKSFVLVCGQPSYMEPLLYIVCVMLD